MVLNHKHLIINAEIGKPPKQGDEKNIELWLKNLIDAINMKIVIGPYAHYCMAEGNNGITAGCNIETSHCQLHCWDKADPAILRFDLYSCADFSVYSVLERLQDFTPIKIDYIVLDRNNSIHTESIGSIQIKPF